MPRKKTVPTEYVLSAAVPPGCTPDEPIDARNAKLVQTTESCGKKLSSETIHESDAFG